MFKLNLTHDKLFIINYLYIIFLLQHADKMKQLMLTLAHLLCSSAQGLYSNYCPMIFSPVRQAQSDAQEPTVH